MRGVTNTGATNETSENTDSAQVPEKCVGYLSCFFLRLMPKEWCSFSSKDWAGESHFTSAVIVCFRLVLNEREAGGFS
jgi:hypothetical protein